jgi:ornithine cyclodeaminase
MSVLVLGHEDIHAVLAVDECEREMASALVAHARGEAYMPLRSIVVPPGAPGVMGLMPAWSAVADHGRGLFAVKSLCLIPANPGRGLDAHQGTVTLFDGETGVPTAILDASAVTEIRTAAVTAVATRTLSREDSSVLAILGAGVQARSHLKALASVRDWDQARVYAPTAAHAQAVVADSPLPTSAAASARDAVEGADVVIVATSSRSPVLEFAWLAHGAHVNAIGASAPSAWEIDIDTVAAAALFCDSRESLRAEAGEYLEAVRLGAISGEDHVRGELGEVLAGAVAGRTDPGELTLFRSLGIAVQDLAASVLAVRRARERGIGTEVAL